MTDFNNYEVEFRIKMRGGKFSSPDGAIKASVIKLMRGFGVTDPSEYTIQRFVEQYFQTVSRVD